MNFTVQRHRLRKWLRLIGGLNNTSPARTPHHHITKSLFTAVSFTQYIMFGSQGKKKIARHTKRPKTQFEETERESEPKLARRLRWSDQEFKTTIINMLRALIDKINSIQQQMVKVSKEMKILTKNRKGSLEIKNIVTEIENTFDGLISRVGTAEQRTFVCEDLWKETSKTE